MRQNHKGRLALRETGRKETRLILNATEMRCGPRVEEKWSEMTGWSELVSKGPSRSGTKKETSQSKLPWAKRSPRGARLCLTSGCSTRLQAWGLALATKLTLSSTTNHFLPIERPPAFTRHPRHLMRKAPKSGKCSATRLKVQQDSTARRRCKVLTQRQGVAAASQWSSRRPASPTRRKIRASKQGFNCVNE